MNWIAVADKKPDKMILALVYNSKGWMYYARARYEHDYDVWILDDPDYRPRLTLDVTHYIEIPDPPQERP